MDCQKKKKTATMVIQWQPFSAKTILSILLLTLQLLSNNAASSSIYYEDSSSSSSFSSSDAVTITSSTLSTTTTEEAAAVAVVAVPPNPSQNRIDTIQKLADRHIRKTRDIFENNVFTNIHYLFLPTWWSDESPKVPLDLNEFEQTCQQVQNYFTEMSFGHMNTLTCEVLNQVTIPISKYNPTPAQVKDAVLAETLKQGREYGDGTFHCLAVLFNRAESGEMAGYNAASVNNIHNFMWIQSINSRNVIRHEMGHNMGHPHHETLAYQRPHTSTREDKGWMQERHDGFDFMSGGNNYDKSDFHIASKWYFGWVDDKHIVYMQPEGSTNWCPHCVKEGTFRIKGFDIEPYTTPKNNDILGVNIPITETGQQIYSYWLQYRTGNDGDAADGLSLHISYLVWTQGAFGATYKQWNYDVNGDTPTTLDSFLTVGSCYVPEPAVVIMEKDPHSADQVIPKICVESLNRMEDVTVSVSFLNDKIYGNYNDKDVTKELVCEKSGVEYDGDSDSDEMQLYKFTGTGMEGTIGVSLCPDKTRADSSVTAYFYDRYPYNQVDLNQPYSYSAFESATFTSSDCCTPGSDITVPGARVVKITSNVDEYWAFPLNEIQIFNQNNVNVAPMGKCYTYMTDSILFSDSSPTCLNDGQVGQHPNTCSCSAFTYVLCVLNEPIDDLRKITLHATNNPNKPQWYQRLEDLQIDVYAEVTGLGPQDEIIHFEDFEFIGHLGTFHTGFDEQDKDPKTVTTNDLDDSYPCPRKNNDPIQTYETKSQLNGSWILIAPNTASSNLGSNSKTQVTVSCRMDTCSPNHYLSSEGICLQCPPNHWCEEGSTSLSRCTPCYRIDDGWILPHPLAIGCIKGDENPQTSNPTKSPTKPNGPTPPVPTPPVPTPPLPTPPVPTPTQPTPTPPTGSNSYRQWRLWSHEDFVVTSGKWSVNDLKFYDNNDCTGTELDTNQGTAIESGHANPSAGPENAFDDDVTTKWTGQPDQNKEYWIGMNFDDSVSVLCVKFNDARQRGTHKVKVQAKAENSNSNIWMDIVETDHDPGSDTKVVLPFFPSTPTSSPVTPTTSPVTPTTSPTTVPTRTPTNTPTKTPTANPVVMPTNPLQCQNGEFKFTVRIQTDKQSSKQNSWTVSKLESNGTTWTELVQSEKLKKSRLFETSICLDEKDCNRFRLVDDKGNGLCCKKGKGHYSIFRNDDLLEFSQFENGKEKIYDMGDKCFKSKLYQ